MFLEICGIIFLICLLVCKLFRIYLFGKNEGTTTIKYEDFNFSEDDEKENMSVSIDYNKRGDCIMVERQNSTAIMRCDLI